MEITQDACIQLLHDQFIHDFKQSENLSQLTREARWDNKSQCLENLSYTEIENMVEWWAMTEKEQPKPKEEQVSAQKGGNWFMASVASLSLPKEIPDTPAKMLDFAKTIWLWILIIFGLAILLGLFIRLFNKFLRYLYAFLNAHRIIFLKVLLPRWDAKTDREQEKEIAKDMKEKIWRMSQVLLNLHKMNEVSVHEKIMQFFFWKHKLVFVYQYEQWQLSCLVWTYPEYQDMVESAIASQYSSASIERVARPNFFKRKFSDIQVLETTKDPLYTIKLYKNIPDDPINNIIDSMWKVWVEDTVSIVLVAKPEKSTFNVRRQIAADRLYKNLDLYEMKRWHWKNLINPFKWVEFALIWPTNRLISVKKEEKEVTMVRMVKAKEDSRNAMWEEAANPTFRSTISLVASSDVRWRPREILNNLESAYNVYSDEYSNSLECSNFKHDILWFLFVPLRRASIFMYLQWFFSKYSYFSTNEIASLYHFPDGLYNRSPSIEWMQYKVVAAPNNLPTFSDDEWNGRVISWVLAENYKKWNLSEILKEYPNHWAVWTRTDTIEELKPIEECSESEKKKHEIVEQDWKQFVKFTKQSTVRWYKTYKWWVLLGVNIYRNIFSPVYIKRDDRTRHHYCIWKSGTWKSVFLQTLARQDIWNWDWICLIDPHGDLAEDMLAYIPKERAKDVVYFEAWDEERPMGLNLYEIDNLDQADRTVNDATEIFLKMFGPEIFWPRIQEYFKYGSLTLLEDFEDRPTLLDVTRLFTDDWYREFKLKKVTNAVVRNWWEKTYNAMWDREKQEIIPYFSSKFVSFNTNRLIRNIIWQTRSAFTFDDIMNNQKILLINLSKGKIWEMNAQLLGMIIVSKVYNAAMARATIPEKDRKDFYLYVDEFQNFVSWTFADILSEARKYRLGLIMAHQYIAQLDPAKWLGDTWGWKSDVKAAVFGNVGTMMSFKVGAPDAEFLEKEYSPVLSGQDIVWIANYKSYIKLNIDNATTRVFSMNSIYTKDYQNKKIVPILKEYSAKKYWRRREFVDAETRARLWLWIDENDLPDNSTPTPDQAPAETPTETQVDTSAEWWEDAQS